MKKVYCLQELFHPGQAKKRLFQSTIAFLLLLFFSSSINAQCPSTSCATHTTTLSTSSIPSCGTTVLNFGDDVDNNSDCEDSNGDNCHKFIISNLDPLITGITADVGKGAQCNGEINRVWSLIDGTCVDHGSSGSQNTFSWDFGASGIIEIWLCDNSSGRVSFCGLCNEEQAPQPVELSYFAAYEKDDMIELHWETETEVDNMGFYIERSADGKKWTVLGFEAGFGNTSSTQAYLFQDLKPFPGYNYYRLRQVDYDGTTAYSPIQVVEMNVSNDKRMQLYPNPNDGKFTLNLYNPKLEAASLKLIDSQGRLIWTRNFSKAEAELYWEEDFDLPPQNIYYFVAQVGEKVNVQKIVALD